ncbi:polyamine-transporting ATPase 13A3-like [Schistocerca piceifrons]|uniref:polyamine-transporting ATPase 13A3-like n=1 Tax=Schistocerca piceifrons TaxID=274613 RepID=UPI001F5FEA37|nr:polyamine-transporting ATPase 13A3-like [Schistocerca piceifrons]
MNDNVRQLNASFKPGKNEKKVDLINEGEEEQMEVYGYRVSAGRRCLAWLGFLATAGLLRLVCHWFPRMLLYLTHCPCSLRDAQKLLCVENYQGKYKMYHIRTFKTISAEAVSSQCAEEMSPESKKLRAYLSNGKVKDLEELRMVSVKKLRYVWDEAEQRLVRLSGLEAAAGYVDMHAHSGISDSLRCSRQAVYGLNDIDVPMQSILTLFLLEVVNPLYIFQVFSLIVWFLEGYYYYTMVIILMSAFGVTSSISQTRKNQRSLHDTVHKTDVVTVDRGASGGGTLEVETTQLVPGDVIVIPPNGCDMYCDAVLLSGSCIVNESMLTGESVPVTKTPLPKTAGGYYNAREDSNHTLFCGTEVMQSRGQKGGSARALVLRTGYLTAKGELVRSILYPPPADFRFDRDVGRFIIVLGIISTCGLIYTIVSKSMRFIRASDIAIKALDLFTIVIPPALPATMTVGKLYGQKRLEKARIFCINSRVINVSGSIDCICFDKTGTLTEDGLDMWGVVEVEPEGRFLQPPARDPQELHDGPLRRGMACCHSLSLIDGEYAGDPLDVRMFEFTKWELEEEEEDVADGECEEDDEDEENLPTVVRPPPGESQDPKEISIVHQFQFSSRLQRMSVVTITAGVQDYDMYCKGSPEMITSLSDPSTVPTGLNETLHEYTSKGYRVIAMGHRRLARSTNLQKLAREDAERDLRFLGIIILENRLKPQTTPVIAELTAARFKIVMITGDNIQTASSVARESGIVLPHETIVEVTARELPTSAPQVYFTKSTIAPPSMPCDGGLSNAAFEVSPGDEETCVGGGGGASPYRLAVTGPTWAALRSARQDLLPRVVAAGAIFARMSSDQKQQLVQELKEMGYYVAMCGDGANDCGALKAAHVGISLSEAEASVASPFTSREPDISCVPRIVREGRAALVTSFGIFKFMVAYSIAEFTSVALLYGIDSNLTDFEFLFIDICLVVHFALTFGNTEAFAGPLVPESPMTGLYTITPMLSLWLQVLVIVAGQTAGFYVVRFFPWFEPFDFAKVQTYACYENYGVFSVSMFQYIIAAIVFSQGKPYRKSVYTNRYLLASLLVMTGVCAYITVYPARWIMNFLQIKLPPAYDVRVVILCMAVVSFVVAMFLENFVVQYLVFKKARAKFSVCGPKGSPKAKLIEEMREDISWPPITKEIPPITMNGIAPTTYKIDYSSGDTTAQTKL